jgi:hypothetical protein
MLAKATRKHHGGRAAGRPRRLDPNCRFSSIDGALTVNTVYFVAQLDRAAELARILTSAGRAVVGLGDPEAMDKKPVTAHGFRLRPVDDEIATLAAAGLRLDENRHLGTGKHPFHLLPVRPSRAPWFAGQGS